MSRIREIADPGRYSVKVNGALIGYYSTTKLYEYLVRADPVPGVRDRDWLHPTTYSASKIHQLGPYGTWVKGSTEWSGDLYTVSTGSSQAVGWQAPGYRPHLLNEAIIQARQKLADDGFNLLEDIAERQQSFDLIGDRLFSLAYAYRAARDAISAYRRGGMNARRWAFWSRKWKEAFRHLGLHKNSVARRISENILAWNYGAAPLISDIDAAVQMVMRGNQLQPLVTVKGVSKEGDLSSTREVGELNTGYLPRTLIYSELCSARCVLVVTPENEALIRAAALRINNPPLLAYELWSKSLFIDWVWPLGDWIDSWATTAGWKFYSGYTMERTVCRTIFTGADDNHGKSVINGSRECMQYRRYRITSFPIPGLPGLKNPFTLKHALNAVAFFGAQLK